MAVNTEGRREIIGLHIGPSEAEVFWTDFLRDLVKRGLKGVKLVISDAHEGLKGAIRRVLGATRQRCRVHWTPQCACLCTPCPGDHRRRRHPPGLPETGAAATKAALEHLGEQVHNRWPKLKAFIADSVEDVTAYMTFPAQHRNKLHSTNPLKRLNKEVKRRADVAGIFPNEDSITP